MCKEQQTLAVANQLDMYYNNVSIDCIDTIEGRIYFAADDAEEMQAAIEADAIVFYVLVDEDWQYADSADLSGVLA